MTWEEKIKEIRKRLEKKPFRAVNGTAAPIYNHILSEREEIKCDFSISAGTSICEIAPSEKDDIRLLLTRIEELRAALLVLLEGHFNLYKSTFGEDSNPEFDLVRIKARGVLNKPVPE